MPVTPFNAPIAFDYKPLGLEAFEKPLSRMQEQYDIVSNKIDESKYDINALSPDVENRDKIISELNAKRDELASELMRSGNYRQAAKKLIGLNKMYQEHPEIKALNSEYKLTMDWIKEGDERALKGDINMDYWKAQKANALAKYSTDKGLAYDPANNTYNSVPRQHLSQDLEKEIQDKMLELGKATPEQLMDIATTHKMDLSTFQWHTRDGSVNYKALDELKKNIAQNILNQPRYVNYLNEVANIQSDTQQYRGDNFNEWAKSQYETEISDLTTGISSIATAAAKGDKTAKAQLESPQYKALVKKRDELANSLYEGNIDPNQARSIYARNYTNDYVNKNAYQIADVLDYRNVKYDDSWSNMSKQQLGMYGIGDDGTKVVDPVAAWVQGTYGTNLTGQNLFDNIGENRKNIDVAVKNLNNVVKVGGKGWVSTLFPEAKYNRIEQAHQVNGVYSALSKNPKNATEFIKYLKEAGVTGVNANSDAYTKIFNSGKLNSDNGLKNLKISANTMMKEASALNDNKARYESMQESVKDSPEVNTVLYNNKINIISAIDVHGRKESIKQYDFIKTPEQLDKYISKQTNGKFKTYGQLMKSNYDLSKIPLFSTLNHTGVVKISTLKDQYEHSVAEGIKGKEYAANISNFEVVGDDAKTKRFRNEVVGLLGATIEGNNLERMSPAFGKTWGNQPGFKDGKLIGTPDIKTLNLSKDSDGRVFASVSVKVKNEDDDGTHNVTTYFKISDPILRKQAIQKIKELPNGDNLLEKRNAQETNIAEFNNSHPEFVGVSYIDNKLTPTANEYVPVAPAFNAQIPDLATGQKTGVQLKIVKTGLAKPGENGQKHYRYAVQAYNEQTGKWINLKDGESEFKADLNSAKDFVTRIENGEY